MYQVTLLYSEATPNDTPLSSSVIGLLGLKNTSNDIEKTPLLAEGIDAIFWSISIIEFSSVAVNFNDLFPAECIVLSNE